MKKQRKINYGEWCKLLTDKKLLESLNDELNTLNIKIALVKQSLNNPNKVIAQNLKENLMDVQDILVKEIENVFYRKEK